LANLLVVVPGAEAGQRAKEVFHSGVFVIERLKGQRPTSVFDSGFAHVASYSRLNGTGTPVVVDPDSGDWLVAVGTWFHEAGYGSGDEARLLARVKQVGPDQLAREVEGFFAIAFGSAADREVALITDVVGTLHCYTRSIGGAVALSVSSLALAALDEVTLDATGCQEFLQTAAMYEDRTFFNEVRKLDAAHCYRYKDGRLQSRQRYWNVAKDLTPDALGDARSVEALREAVVAAAKKIQGLFPRPVVDLTGGYDSRVGVAAFMSAGVPFQTAVAGAPTHPDVVISRALASRVGLVHRYFCPAPVSTFEQLQNALALTDGEYDLVDYARIQQVQSDLAANFDISVNSYSGEIGRGYGWEVLVPRTGERIALGAAKVAGRRFYNPGYDASIVPPNIRLNPLTHFCDIVKRIDAGFTSLPNTLQYDYCMTMMRCQRWYGRIASSTNQIWPCMSFFLLRSIIKPMLETDTKSRKRSLLFRRLLAQIQPEFAKYPLELGYPPSPVSWATIHRFWPIIPLYLGKVLQRLRRYASRTGAAPGGAQDSPRVRLWRDESVQHVLHPTNLLSTAIFDARKLEEFLDRSKQQEFAFDGQWCLVLSLECTLHRLKALRSDVCSHVP
jgi:hypothetical protein